MIGGSGQVPPTEVKGKALRHDQVAKKQWWRSLNLLLGSHLCLPLPPPTPILPTHTHQLLKGIRFILKLVTLFAR